MELSGVPRRLLRSERDRVIAGVIGGLGEYLNIDSNILRLLAVALFIVSPAIMALLYLAAVFLIPKAGGDKPLISFIDLSKHSTLIIGFILFLDRSPEEDLTRPPPLVFDVFPRPFGPHHPLGDVHRGEAEDERYNRYHLCLLYTSPSPRDRG